MQSFLLSGGRAGVVHQLCFRSNWGEEPVSLFFDSLFWEETAPGRPRVVVYSVSPKERERERESERVSLTWRCSVRSLVQQCGCLVKPNKLLNQWWATITRKKGLLGASGSCLPSKRFFGHEKPKIAESRTLPDFAPKQLVLPPPPTRPPPKPRRTHHTAHHERRLPSRSARCQGCRARHLRGAAAEQLLELVPRQPQERGGSHRIGDDEGGTRCLGFGEPGIVSQRRK